GYNVMETPCKRDLLGELTEACKKYDIKIGFYYSHWLDWDGTGGEVDFAYMENDEYVHPSDEEYQAYWENKCLAQVSELIDAYDPTFFWFDTWSEDAFEKLTDERLNQLIGLIREKSPDCLINSRINFKNPPDDVDYISTNDNEFPDQGFDKPWETSGTLNHSWAYHKLDFDWKSTEQLLRYLIGNAALGGNYQLNVGPTGDGLFQPAAIKRLREIGSWMAVNSESIYGTEAGPTGKTSWGASTQKGDVVYLHLCDVQAGMALRVEELSSVNHITVLETGEQLTFTQDENALWVNLPKGLSGLQIPVLKLV
ncbi:MAG: alpha-L-fucosidase, partial [Lentisphaeria bacterium]|nr:alpha-L-fucosidase [Lentisphaeria bacterium]